MARVLKAVTEMTVNSVLRSENSFFGKTEAIANAADNGVPSSYRVCSTCSNGLYDPAMKPCGGCGFEYVCLEYEQALVLGDVTEVLD